MKMTENLAKITEMLSTSEKEFDKISKYIKILQEQRKNEIELHITAALKHKKSKKQSLLNLCPIRGLVLKQMLNQKSFKGSELEIIKNQFKEIYASLNACFTDRILEMLLEICLEFIKVNKISILEEILPEDLITSFVYLYFKGMNKEYFINKDPMDLVKNLCQLHNNLIKKLSPSLKIIEFLVNYFITNDKKNINKIWIGLSNQNFKEKVEFKWILDVLQKVINSGDENVKNIFSSEFVNFLITISSKKNPNNVFFDELISSNEFQNISDKTASNIFSALTKFSSDYSGLLFTINKLSSFLIKKIKQVSIAIIYKKLLIIEKLNFNKLSSLYYIIKNYGSNSMEQIFEFSCACLRVFIKNSDQKALEYFKHTLYLYLKYINFENILVVLSELFSIISTPDNSDKYKKAILRLKKFTKIINNDYIDVFSNLSFSMICFNIESTDKILDFIKNIKFSLECMKSNQKWFGAWFEEIIEISILPYKSAIIIAYSLIKKSENLIYLDCIDVILKVLESPRQELFSNSNNELDIRTKVAQCPIPLFGDDIDITTLGEDSFEKIDQYLSMNFQMLAKSKDTNINKNNLLFIQTRMALMIDTLTDIPASVFFESMLAFKILVVSSSKNIVKNQYIFKKLQNSAKKLIKKIKNDHLTLNEVNELLVYFKKCEKLLPVVSFNQVWGSWLDKILKNSCDQESKEQFVIVQNVIKRLILRFLRKKKENLNHNFFQNLFLAHFSNIKMEKLVIIVLKNLHSINGPKFKNTAFVLFWNSLIKYSKNKKSVLKGIRRFLTNIEKTEISSKNMDLFKKTFQIIFKKYPELKEDMRNFIISFEESDKIKEIMKKLIL